MKFLLQTIVIFEEKNHNDEEINMIYNFLTNLDNEILNNYLLTSDVIPYENNLELCVEVIRKLIMIFEDKEEYEKCAILKYKQDDAIEIMNKNRTKLLL